MLFAFFLSLFTASSVFASHSSNVAPSVACTQQLEGIVYVPKNCAYNYLKSINKVLQVQSPLFWNNPAQARSAVSSFQATYGVYVSFIDALGKIYSAPGVPLAGAPNAMGVAYARANALGEGFSATDYPPAPLPNVAVSTYASNYWNMDGQMYTVLISIPKVNVPNFC